MNKSQGQATDSNDRLQQPFSWFENVNENVPADTCTLREWVAIVRSDRYRATVEAIRAEPDKKRRDIIKKRLPAVTFSVCMDTRDKDVAPDARNYRPSGILQIDVDLKDNPGVPMDEIRSKLMGHPSVLMVATSPSGAIKAACAIPAEVSTHKQAFAAAKAEFAALGVAMDGGTHDVPRLCYLTHDPEAWLREGPVEILAIPENNPEVESPALLEKNAPADGIDPGFSLVSTVEDVKLVLSHIPPRPEYAEWLRISNAVRNAGVGEAAAIQLLKEWSPEEEADEYARLFKSPLKEVGPGTLVEFAKANGYDKTAHAREIHARNTPAGRVKVASRKTTPEKEKPTPARPIDFFYDGSRYFLDHPPQYVPMDCRSVARHLIAARVDKTAIEGRICQIQTTGFIHFAGPLAGHQRGVHETNGVRILATTSPKIIEAKAGEWPTLQAVIVGALEDPDAGEGGMLQVETFLAWLKVARESLVSGRRRPGQALALAGPIGACKSLLMDIAERVLGGRRANPYPYFTGRTNFNADLAGAELLAVDDDAGSTDIRARRALAANIKACLFSGAVRIEGKNKAAFTFRPCWRMMLALNDEPEALLVLPPITDDLADKIILFRCHKRPLPMLAHTLEEREAFFAQLMSELPAMLAELEQWEIPQELREDRCGIRYFHHPAILSGLLELSPEGQLLQLINSAHSAGALPLPWTGTAAELKGILTHHPTTARDAEKLLGGWIAATGSYLGKLDGGRVEKLPMTDGVSKWRITSGVVE